MVRAREAVASMAGVSGSSVIGKRWAAALCGQGPLYSVGSEGLRARRRASSGPAIYVSCVTRSIRKIKYFPVKTIS
jgi:hypothetical protein